MACTRCPHFVRNGKPSIDRKSIEFSENCGLLLKQDIEPPVMTGRKAKSKNKINMNQKQLNYTDPKYNCIQYPFQKGFEYFSCQVYQDTFKGGLIRNGVFPSSQYDYTDSVSDLASVTDMELL